MGCAFLLERCAREFSSPLRRSAPFSSLFAGISRGLRRLFRRAADAAAARATRARSAGSATSAAASSPRALDPRRPERGGGGGRGGLGAALGTWSATEKRRPGDAASGAAAASRSDQLLAAHGQLVGPGRARAGDRQHPRPAAADGHACGRRPPGPRPPARRRRPRPPRLPGRARCAGGSAPASRRAGSGSRRRRRRRGGSSGTQAAVLDPDERVRGLRQRVGRTRGRRW